MLPGPALDLRPELIDGRLRNPGVDQHLLEARSHGRDPLADHRDLSRVQSLDLGPGFRVQLHLLDERGGVNQRSQRFVDEQRAGHGRDRLGLPPDEFEPHLRVGGHGRRPVGGRFDDATEGAGETPHAEAKLGRRHVFHVGRPHESARRRSGRQAAPDTQDEHRSNRPP
jgi:hypothetical protein